MVKFCYGVILGCLFLSLISYFFVINKTYKNGFEYLSTKIKKIDNIEKLDRKINELEDRIIHLENN